MMTGEPLRLYVDPDAKPYAVHKPAIIPIHWQEQVFNDLERDVRLGVLEKLPQNTPVTWCSRMVVAPKADGSPRRTVDLQHLNRHAVQTCLPAEVTWGKNDYNLGEDFEM